MMICIYCGKIEANSSEHILQDHLGSDWEKEEILCDTCNTLFGSTIDNVLASEFNFFRNFLGIAGKKGKIPSWTGKNDKGASVTRDGKTGRIALDEKPNVQKITENGEIKSFHVHAQTDKSPNIIKQIEQYLEKQGLKGITQVKDYEATSPGTLEARLSYTTPTYIALRKSSINFWCSLFYEKDEAKIREQAQKIYQFAEFHKKNKDNSELLVKKSKELGIDGFPLTVFLSDTAQKKLLDLNQLAHVLFLVCNNKQLFGAVRLFGSIQWGFKLADKYNAEDMVALAVIDPLTRKNLGIRNSDLQLQTKDFQFKDLPTKERLAAMQQQFGQAASFCADMEHYTSVKSAIVYDDIQHAFPITNKNVIMQIFEERATVLCGWFFAQHGVRPDVFRQEEGKTIVNILVAQAMNDPCFSILTAETFKKFIFCCTKINEFLLEKFPILVGFLKSVPPNGVSS